MVFKKINRIYIGYAIMMKSIDQELIKRLNGAQPINVKKFSFNGIETLAKVIKVHDADTITAMFEYHNEIVKYNIRIDGIDSPELYSKNKEEMELSKKGKDYVTKLIWNTIVKIKLKDFDKYGRILGDIILLPSNTSNENESNVSDLLIQGGFARSYNGKHKNEWK